MLFRWICWTEVDACYASLKPRFMWRWRRLRCHQWQSAENEDLHCSLAINHALFVCHSTTLCLCACHCKVFPYTYLAPAVSEVPQRAVFMPSVTVKEGYLHKHKAEGPQLLSRFAFKKRYFWLTSETLSYAKTPDWQVSIKPTKQSFIRLLHEPFCQLDTVSGPMEEGRVHKSVFYCDIFKMPYLPTKKAYLFFLWYAQK